MKVLVISHNVFSATNNMGKTLIGYFSKFNSDEITQFYIHSQVPTTNVCKRYYRITDKEAIKSIFGVPCGRIFTSQDIQSKRVDSRTDTGVSAVLYQKARKRTAMTYIARNTWWKLSHWNNKKIKKWIAHINPDCIFFASGDYAFMYDIARKIAESRGIPLLVSCMDDYYLYNKNSSSWLGRIQHYFFMKSVRKTMEYASKIFCICDKMSSDYSKMFHKECITIHTPSSFSCNKPSQKNNRVCYLGNLGYQRYRQLIDIGRALKGLGFETTYIDVYSAETQKDVVDLMNKDNGIIFHGAIDAEEVAKIMRDSLAIIHTESFDEAIRKSIQYSVSTKIADSLMSGTCIFAYGPSEIASIKYLIDNDAAIFCTDKCDLEHSLKILLKDENKRKKVIHNALSLGKQNHSLDVTPITIRNELQCVCGE